MFNVGDRVVVLNGGFSGTVIEAHTNGELEKMYRISLHDFQMTPLFFQSELIRE